MPETERLRDGEMETQKARGKERDRQKETKKGRDKQIQRETETHRQRGGIEKGRGRGRRESMYMFRERGGRQWCTCRDQRKLS